MLEKALKYAWWNICYGCVVLFKMWLILKLFYFQSRWISRFFATWVLYELIERKQFRSDQITQYVISQEFLMSLNNLIIKINFNFLMDNVYSFDILSELKFHLPPWNINIFEVPQKLCNSLDTYNPIWIFRMWLINGHCLHCLHK